MTSSLPSSRSADGSEEVLPLLYTQNGPFSVPSTPPTTLSPFSTTSTAVPLHPPPTLAAPVLSPDPPPLTWMEEVERPVVGYHGCLHRDDHKRAREYGDEARRSHSSWATTATPHDVIDVDEDDMEVSSRHASSAQAEAIAPSFPFSFPSTSSSGSTTTTTTTAATTDSVSTQSASDQKDPRLAKWSWSEKTEPSAVEEKVFPAANGHPPHDGGTSGRDMERLKPPPPQRKRRDRSRPRSPPPQQSSPQRPSFLESEPSWSATESADTGADGPRNATADALRTLSEDQQEAFRLVVNSRRSVFITGGAGTGKSHLLRTIISALPRAYTFVTATTGIAALNLSGSTLHSFAGCGRVERGDSRAKVLGIVRKSDRRVKLWKQCSTLIIDEVSMLDAWLFETLDYVARWVRERPHEPFGGIQLVLSGDFLQLPPVVKNKRPRGGDVSPLFCFETDTWLRVNPQVCLLSSAFRQRQNDFFALLNEMRLGELSGESVTKLTTLSSSIAVNFIRRELLNRHRDNGPTTPAAPPHPKAAAAVKSEEEATAERKVFDHAGAPLVKTAAAAESALATAAVTVDGAARVITTDEAGNPTNDDFDGYTILRARRDEVDRENDLYYSKLTTEEFFFVGVHTGEGGFPSGSLPEVVRLRVGCRVMLIKNVATELGLVNGSTGTVTGFIDFSKNYQFRNPNVTRWDAAKVCVGRGKDDQVNHTMLPIVQFELLRGTTVTTKELVVETQEWVEKQGEKTVSRTVQMPLILAYAITIHKSQGMSLTQVDIDFKNIFETGQAYVALSRCTDLTQIRLHGFNAHVVSTNAAALAYYKALQLQHQSSQWSREHTVDRGGGGECPAGATLSVFTPYGYDLATAARSTLRYEPRRGAVCEVKAGGRGADHGMGMLDEYADRDGEGSDSSYPILPNESTRLDELRLRIAPLLELTAVVRRAVRQQIVPVQQVRDARLVFDVSALFDLITGTQSARTYDVLFGQHGNMMRIPIVVKRLIVEVATIRGSDEAVGGTSRTENGLSVGEGNEVETAVAAADGSQPPTSHVLMMEAGEVAAEALALMERAAQDFLLDEQRDGQSTSLPPPLPHWERFLPVLPLLQPNGSASLTLSSSTTTAADQDRVGHPAPYLPRPAVEELDFLLNRDPRETAMHQGILEYAMYLRETYGEGVMICTDSHTLAAYALALGFRATSIEFLAA